jgi:glycerophosphoryl diester phosphodiesterase
MTTSPHPLLLGHRGDRCAAPENTFIAFDLAMANGCDGFEFDVRLTLDSKGIICHDPDLAGLSIAATTFEVLEHNLNETQINRGVSQKGLQTGVPRLEDIFRHYARTAFLDIELKVPGLERAVLIGLKKWPPRNGYVVSSFLPEVLLNIMREDPRVPLGFICDNQEALPLWRDLDVEFVIPKYNLVSPQLVEEVHKIKRQLFVWTVNEAPAMRHFASLGIDGIISDDSRLLVQTLKK